MSNRLLGQMLEVGKEYTVSELALIEEVSAKTAEIVLKEERERLLEGLGKLNANWRMTRKAGWMMQSDLDQFILALKKGEMPK
ncbi:unnamed protein product [marine sediment metagenome]|uniref:Uncharacterized protein n=1 Tax=marine sediment metagenome TaxID=412755 RepID=X1C2C8_9ZZZZ